LNLEAGSYKDAFMHALRNVDVAVTAATVRVLCGFLLNKSTDPDILDAAGAPFLTDCASFWGSPAHEFRVAFTK
jgi:hypothetical protein